VHTQTDTQFSAENIISAIRFVHLAEIITVLYTVVIVISST